MVNKIYLIGSARSGKSFLAEKISKKRGGPHFDLDDVVFINLGVEKRKEEERDLMLGKILENNKWVIEGAYNESWILPALEEAGLIIWLDTPPFRKLWRFIKRVSQEGINGPGNIYGRGRLALGLKYKEWDRSKNSYSTLLNNFKSKLTIVRSKDDIEQLLKKF